MDSDTKKLIVLGFFTGLGGLGMSYLYKQLNSLKDKKNMILEQGSPHTPQTLLSKKDSLTTNPEYIMLSGVCMQGANKGSIYESQIDSKNML